MLLDLAYFNNEDTPKLAYDLIGKFLCRKQGEIISRYMITEVEAYHGFKDKACHARFGKTPRNAVMFAHGGHSYVYLCYGIHWLLNLVTGPENFPAAVLIRGIEDIFGPGRVTRKLNIDKSFNGRILT
ncbi:MAG: DNA-3-methyladenine glycosylase, partial [Burkholderiales bacterium]